MVKTLVLFDQIYNIPKEREKKDVSMRYLKYLNEHVKDFPNTTIKVKKLREFDGRFEVSISGPEEVFILNFLKKEIGTINEFKDISEGEIYKGNLIEVGQVGFGLFVDCAFMNPKVDVLINLHTLREQLCKGREKSLPQIIKSYDFIDHFPVQIKILKIDRENLRVQGELGPDSLSLFRRILDENLEAVFLIGGTKGQFKKVITKKGHYRDIISIKRFGFLENMVLLKDDSNAPGIISRIGKDLTSCKFSALRPQRIRTLFN